MAYMTNLQQAVLFGGWSYSLGTYLDDTWSWQGGCWTLDQLASGPSARTGMAMAYDAAHKVVVAFGGRTNPSIDVFSNETWLWNGKLWTKAATGPDLGFTWAAFDENLQQTLLYGEGPNGVAQTWMWDGSKWHQWQGQSPPLRSSSGMVFDPSNHGVLLFGGLGEEHMTMLNDTWEWDGSKWSKLSPAHSPSPRQDFALASFTVQKVVLLGGGRGARSDAWVWNGSDWAQVAGIGVRFGASATDVGTGILLFGGSDLGTQTNDAEVWDGATWAAA